MKPENDTITPSATTDAAPPAAEPTANKKPRMPHARLPLTEEELADRAEAEAELDAAMQKHRAAFDADVSKWLGQVSNAFGGTIRETRRIEAATRLACAMLRHGHDETGIPERAVKMADLIIAEAHRTEPKLAHAVAV